ncbi:MAG: HlyD family type I secretion periplasmic adaptor subunit [Deltaproteobacteria bacterium]|jgi:adhesin transport system membrane fusion protein|nr:HlyD family type I secretion periplasmic adaptor subunit [Deltaproteobacteria bacterium]
MPEAQDNKHNDNAVKAEVPLAAAQMPPKGVPLAAAQMPQPSQQQMPPKGTPLAAAQMPPKGVPLAAAQMPQPSQQQMPPKGTPLAAAQMPPKGVPLAAAQMPSKDTPLAAAQMPPKGVPLAAAQMPQPSQQPQGAGNTPVQATQTVPAAPVAPVSPAVPAAASASPVPATGAGVPAVPPDAPAAKPGGVPALLSGLPQLFSKVKREDLQRIKNELVSNLFFQGKVDPIDLQYMTEVDAALHRHGKPRAFLMSAGVLVFFFVFIIWASIAQLDEVTRGQGQVVSALPIQEIQYMEGGVLESMLVRAGDDVAKGQVLANISNVRASSDLQRNKDQQAVLRAMVVRLQAERDGTIPVFPQDLTDEYPSVAAGQMDLYQNHIDQRESEMRALEAQLEQRLREVEEAQARRNSLSESLRIATETRDKVAPLAKSGVYSALDFSRMEQEVVRLRGDLESTVQQISRGQSAVDEAGERINSRQREWQSTIQEEYNTRSAALSEIDAMIAQGTDTVNRKEVRSPVKGKVKRILISTIGGTVQSGATIMEIIPIDDNLLIEARISPNDRAFLRTSDNPAEKQPAVVKITAYDFSIYGGLEATLEYISDDTIEDKKGEVYFEVRLLTRSNSIMYHGKALPIMPGMTAQVDILTGKKSVLSYLLKPIVKAQQNAFRER